ncbi:MAG TPA: TadE/TadG family type IV pilus assembly protein [Tepidisphaeraceae bacterium]|nr:TadE/TadG family type IV pilus assembly protein [Tepidisphaeraceae bacterium]
MKPKVRSILSFCRRTESRRGNTLIEAAFVFNILLLLSFCTVEFGYYLYAKHTIQGAAREGARAAVVPGATTTDVTNAVARSLFASGMNSGTTSIDSAKFTVTLNPANPAAAAGTAIQVDVVSTMGKIGPKPLFFMSNTKSITGSTVMRKEG